MINIYNGTFQCSNGSPVANGSLELRLSWDSTQTVSPGTVVAGSPIIISLDSNGNAPKTTIWSNAELIPSGSYYIAKIYDDNGIPVLKSPLIWEFMQATGANVNLSSVESLTSLPV